MFHPPSLKRFQGFQANVHAYNDSNTNNTARKQAVSYPYWHRRGNAWAGWQKLRKQKGYNREASWFFIVDSGRKKITALPTAQPHMKSHPGSGMELVFSLCYTHLKMCFTHCTTTWSPAWPSSTIHRMPWLNKKNWTMTLTPGAYVRVPQNYCLS